MASFLVAGPGVGATLHAATRGKFIYIVSNDPQFDNRVVWLESGDFETGVWREEKFGTRIETRTPMEPVGAGPGIGITGQYQFHWRLVDTVRSRHTRLSVPATDVIHTDEKYMRFTLPELLESVDPLEERRQYNRWEVWGTTSTLDPAHASGGRTFFVDSWDVNPAFRSGATLRFVDSCSLMHKDYNDGSLFDSSNIGDVGMAASQEYDFTADDAAPEPPSAERIAVYQDIVVLAAGEKPAAGGNTESSGTVTLRWSPSHRLAPEEFPEVNNFPTRITRGRAALLEISEYLYVLGDGPYYRMQRRGSFVEILQMGSGQSLVSPEAACVAGNRIFAIMEHGAVFIDPATGAVRDLQALDRVLRDRWFHSGLVKANISCAYDNHMKAIFVQSGQTEETVILWTKTGRITVREDARFMFVRQVDHADGSRAMHLMQSANRISQPFAFPKASVLPQSMYGLPRDFNMNREIISSEAGSQSTLVVLDGDPFGALDLTGMSVRILSGPLAGQGFAITETFPDPGLRISRVLTRAELVGFSLSIGGVPFRVVGGPIASGEPTTTHRKSMEGARAVVSRFRGDTGYLESRNPVLRIGVVSYENMAATDQAAITAGRGNVPYSLNNWVPLPAHAGHETVVPSRDLALSATNPAVNHGPLEATGALLFPYAWCDVGNFSFELHEFAVSGTIGPSEFIEDVPDD